MADAVSTVALLAGGLATRMRPLTEKVPKAMLEVAGEPFVAHQLRLFRQRGVERVVMCLGFLGEQVEAFVGDGSRFGLDVAYSYDGETLLGTGGALLKALPLLDDPFFIVYGDSYLEADYAEIGRSFIASGAPALMTVFRNDDRWDASNVVFQAGKIVLYSKRLRRPDMFFIDYGLGVMTKEALRRRERDGPIELAAIYEELAAEGRLAGFEVSSRFYEIGSPTGLTELDARLRAVAGR